METGKKEEIILRIISKEQKINLLDKSFVLLSPSKEVKLEATEVFNDVVKKYRFDESWLSEKFCLSLLVKNGLCSLNVDGNLKVIEKKIDDLKVQLFQSMIDIKRNKKVKTLLDKTKEKQNELISIRHSLDHLTLKGFAEMIKRQFLVFKTIRDKNKNIIWNNIEDINVFLFEKVTNKVLQETLTTAQIREIARTEPWRTYWGIKNTDVFEGSVFDLTDEQKTLVLYSKMYDSTYEHPECPSEKVINDDDLFDGWMISEQRKRDKEKKENQLDNKLNKSNLAKADELFVPVSSLEEAREIDSFNDQSGKFVKAQRNSVVKKKGKAVDADFMDRKSQIQQKANQQFMNSVRGGKK